MAATTSSFVTFSLQIEKATHRVAFVLDFWGIS
jgi:hypothetical protein